MTRAERLAVVEKLALELDTLSRIEPRIGGDVAEAWLRVGRLVGELLTDAAAAPRPRRRK